ncbi:ABC transporter permease [Chelativorans sp. SCAU2101]|jgi:alcohol ABC transporter, permease protein|uniref:Transport permease protein n=2 Tax=Chelativorans petroleitrophicus TaxID=2975484 RepID=A0A9X3AZX0_9HYPH|nr:ABC transporter permease [Chelativorans petroleitrophicus]MCT8990394.1 ABC transporter permease [Chelativorans petroleitrophicus]
MKSAHAFSALRAIVRREVVKFTHQYGRLFSALVRPALWLVAFAAGFHNILGVSIIPPYRTYITYQEYMIPGLLGMVLLFNSMQSSLSLVYDREMGTMRLLLTAPLPRWYLLLCKLMGGAALSTLQGYAFLLVAWLFGAELPASGYWRVLPALIAAALMLGAIGLLLSVYVRQLENFAGTMNFVIFPMFFISTALYPLWKVRESGAEYLYQIALVNPFTHAVELIRFAAYGQLNVQSLAVVVGMSILCFLLSVIGYDPQRGLIRRRGGMEA